MGKTVESVTVEESKLEKLKQLLRNGCSACDFDEAEGYLLNHCDKCCREITTLAYEMLII